MFNDRFRFALADRAPFDPTGGLLTAGLMIGGAAATAGGTLAGGSAAAQAGQMQRAAAAYKATQLRQNAGLAIRGAQAQAADTQTKTGLLTSASTARAAASGVDAGVGSPATNVGDIAKRGSYLSLMDLWRGQSQATGLLNEAQATTYGGDVDALEGEEKRKASYLAAAGTLAGSAGSGLGNYAKNNPPAPSSMPAGYNPNGLGGLY